MEQPPSPNALPPTPKRNGNSSSEKKKLPTAQELVAHYESQGIETSEASIKVIEDLQNVLYRVISSRGQGQKDKFMNKNKNKNSRTLDTVNTRLAILEIKLDSKPGYVETLGIGIGAGAIFKGLGSVVPHVFEGVRVVTSDIYKKCDSGLIYLDIEVGKGDCPQAGQQVTFHYIGYNESGRRIDSTYLQGSPAKIRFGTNALVPGFEEGIKDMKPGGKRRIIIPPELGPPVGPSTFFSAKQFEVFDVEMLSIQNCERRL